MLRWIDEVHMDDVNQNPDPAVAEAARGMNDAMSFTSSKLMTCPTTSDRYQLVLKARSPHMMTGLPVTTRTTIHHQL